MRIAYIACGLVPLRIVQQGETLDGGYRVEADSVTLVHLPLGVRESILLSSSR